MSDLITGSDWEVVPASAQAEIARIDDRHELVEPAGTPAEIVGTSLLALLHLIGSTWLMFTKGVSVERVLWFALGVATVGWLVMLFVQRSRRRTYFLLPSGIVQNDRNGSHFLPRERIDDIFTRQAPSDRNDTPGGRGPAVELLLDSGGWVGLHISRDETDRVVDWLAAQPVDQPDA